MQNTTDIELGSIDCDKVCTTASCASIYVCQFLNDHRGLDIKQQVLGKFHRIKFYNQCCKAKDSLQCSFMKGLRQKIGNFFHQKLADVCCCTYTYFHVCYVYAHVYVYTLCTDMCMHTRATYNCVGYCSGN